MTKPSSHCNADGHSRGSCAGGGDEVADVKLFGVKLTTTTDGGSLVKKTASMVNLSSDSSGAAEDSADEYHSDDPDRGSAGTARRRNRRNKGIPWTEEEHRNFLIGLGMLGKGAWRGISRNYVPSKTPSQVASHAQKYFMRQNNASGRKKRSSVFDIVPNRETRSLLPKLSGIPFPDVGADNRARIVANMDGSSLDLSLKPAFEPFPFRLGPPNAYPTEDNGAGAYQHQIIGPVSAVSEEPIRESLGISKFSNVTIEPSALSLSQPGTPLV